MASKKRKQTKDRLPLQKGEVWEVGRRALDVHVADLARQGEQPEILLAVQADAAGSRVVSALPVPSSTPVTALADFTLRAMQQPLHGSPHRPEVVRVGSQAEAEVLAVALAASGVAVEVSAQLEAFDAAYQDLQSMFSGKASDYRTRAEESGETLSAAGLQAFFRTARTFYREELWSAYGDEVMFDIALEPASGPTRTLYGIMMGSMGEEFGLALFHSLDDLEQFYALSVEHLDHFHGFPEDEEEEAPDPEDVERTAEVTARFLQVSSLSLTYTPQRDVPPPLADEARQLKLPLANKSAFPLVLQTGQGAMQVASATGLGDMCSALRAILDWDKQVDKMDVEDELDVTITSKLQAVAGFLPALTAQTTLRDNPFRLEDEDDDDDDDEDEDEDLLPDLENLFGDLAPQPAGRPSPPPSGKATSGNKARATGKNATVPAAGADCVYTLDVYLVDGPLPDAYADQEVSRLLEIRGRQTLHDLHQAIFQAFERWEEHLYEFNLGSGPADRSALYFYRGGWDDGDEEGADPTTTALNTLDLQVGRRFGYTFDMGDQWEHVIEVVAVQEGPGKGKYPRVTKAVGDAPPQYPDDDEDEDDEE